MNISITSFIPCLVGVFLLLTILSSFASIRVRGIITGMMLIVVALSGGYMTIYPDMVKRGGIEPFDSQIELLNDISAQVVWETDAYYMSNKKVNIIFDLNEDERPYVSIKKYSGDFFNIKILKLETRDVHANKFKLE